MGQADIAACPYHMLYKSSITKSSKHQNMEALMKLLQSTSSQAMFFVGLSIRLIVEMRQFSRRGLGGLQHFNSYFIGLITLFLERILKLIAFVLMLWGLWRCL
jgi:hypothetical protein